MAGRLSLWGAGELLRTYISKTAGPPPSFWLALIKAESPTPYMVGAELDEPDFASYARVEIPNNSTNWESTDQLHILFNANPVIFVTAQERWGRIGYWALCNAETEGYVFSCGEMETGLTVAKDDQVVVAAGEIVTELGPFFTDEVF